VRSPVAELSSIVFLPSIGRLRGSVFALQGDGRPIVGSQYLWTRVSAEGLVEFGASFSAATVSPAVPAQHAITRTSRFGPL